MNTLYIKKKVLSGAFYACALSLFLPLSVSASSSSVLKKAELAYDQRLYKVASGYYEEYLQDPKHSAGGDVMLKLADSYWQMREYDKAGAVYSRVSGSNSSLLTVPVRIRLSNLSARKNDYSKAAYWLDSVPGYESRKQGYETRSKISKLSKDSADWKIEALNLNSRYSEFSPFLYKDYLFFSSNRAENKVVKANGWDGLNYTRLWQVSEGGLSGLSGTSSSSSLSRKMDEETIGKATQEKKKLAGVYENIDNKPMSKHEDISEWAGMLGAESAGQGSLVGGLSALPYNVASASSDSLGNIYFSANGVSSLGIADETVSLYHGKYVNNEIQNIEKVQLPAFAYTGNLMHPAINPGGTILVFSSNTGNSDGSYDLYVAERRYRDVSWGIPMKLSDKVNSAGNEVFPMISEDGYLYFSSDGREGYGGLDVYRIKLSNLYSGKSDAELLGAPLNSSSDDFGFYSGKDGEKGYLTSDREVGNDNIYRFTYTPRPRTYTVNISGQVRDRYQKNALAGATVMLLNPETHEVLIDKANTRGEYSFTLHKSGSYVIKAAESKHNDECMLLPVVADAKTDSTTLRAATLMMEPTKNAVWVLKDLLYDLGKWNIRVDAEAPLDSLAQIMKENPDLKVELGAHTDSRGNDASNLVLSQRRAASAVDYVVKKGGISADRIKAKGYGELKPLNRCKNGVRCTEDEYQQNRRTEIKVIQGSIQAAPLDGNSYRKGQKYSVDEFPKGYFDKCK